MPNLENFSIKEIKSIVDCLCYLEFSTRDNGIDEINDAIRAALIKVREWIDDRTMNEYFFDINNQKQNDYTLGLNEIIHFLEGVIQLDKDQLGKIIHVIGMPSNQKSNYN